MRLIINGKQEVIPSSLDEITLKQRIDFQNLHGNLLDQMTVSLEEIEDPFEREFETIEVSLERMFRTIAFFTNHSIESIKESEHVDTIVRMYAASMAIVFEEESKIIEHPQYEFVFKGELWILHTPELKNGDKMTFGEFIDSKQIVQDMMGLGKGRWECMLQLCAIYLRKKDEEYQESFLYDDSDRLKLLEELPLSIALQVGFFLNSSLNMYMNISQFSSPQELSKRVNLLKNTSNISDGLIS